MHNLTAELKHSRFTKLWTMSSQKCIGTAHSISKYHTFFNEQQAHSQVSGWKIPYNYYMLSWSFSLNIWFQNSEGQLV